MFISPDEIKSELNWTRQEVVRSIDDERVFDIAVIGGGIHGAAVARLAAFNGLKTVLLEASDYASATSSRSSKLAHGGLRYLAMYDFRQVFESVKAREDLFSVAGHLVKPWPFLIPIRKGEWFMRLQLAVGLPLYEFFTSQSERRHSWILPDNEAVKSSFLERASEFLGCFRYFDGVMSDTRLVIETVLAARQEGARCLNYARIDSMRQLPTGQHEVGWTDQRTGEKHSLRAGVVVNCAGPWAPSAGRLKVMPGKVCYSRGSHLLFDYSWPHPALFLPLAGKNRYYFVLPHPGGTLVGTTEREFEGVLPEDPQPTADEVEEILTRLKRDLPGHRLDRSTLYYAFAGIRTLPLRPGTTDTSALSRRHIWEFQGGVLSLYGGKYTSAYWTAFEGLRILQEQSKQKFNLVDIRDRPLPGSFAADTALQGVLARCQSESQEKAVRNTHRIFGGRIGACAESSAVLEFLGEELLSGAVRLALQVEQVETVEDLLRRRLELELSPGYGLKHMSQIKSIVLQLRPDINFDGEMSDYQNRLGRLRETIGLGPL